VKGLRLVLFFHFSFSLFLRLVFAKIVFFSQQSLFESLMEVAKVCSLGQLSEALYEVD
jgi:hypothetical protein